MRNRLIKGGAAAVAVLLVATLSIYFLRTWYLERNVPLHEIAEWVEANQISRVLVVFAHQDDELLVAGTLAGLDNAGVQTRLLTLTNGDGEGRPEGQTVKQLVDERTAELEEIARLLGLDSLEQGLFSDKGFMDVADEQIENAILERIIAYRPDSIITWDTEKGLYGHPHHVRVARLAIEVVQTHQNDPDFPKVSVYSSTVSVWIREVLKRLSPIYQRRYYEISPGESIEPTYSLSTKKFAEARRKAFAVYHKRGAVRGLNPLADFPSQIEDFVFDREYFYQSF